MNHTSSTNGFEAMQSAGVYVTKIGGENAGKLSFNSSNAISRARNGIKQVTAVSAIRSSADEYSSLSADTVVDLDSDGRPKPGFNTTSHLIAIAKGLSSGPENTDQLLDIAQRIADFTKAVIRREAHLDADKFDADDVIAELCTLVDEQIVTNESQNALMDYIRSSDCSIVERGSDLIIRTRNGYTSLTGFGEHLAKYIYKVYLERRGIAAEHLGIDQAFYSVFPRIHQIHNPGQTLRSFQGLAAERIRGIIESHDVVIAGGYMPLLGSERGYSDKTGALLACATKAVRDDALYIIEKEFPIMSADPRKVDNTRTVTRMTHFLARELFGNNRGAKGSAVHPGALEMLSANGMDIVVLNPEVPSTTRNTTLVQNFQPEPNGVEIVASKKVSFALQISSSDIIGNPLFEAGMTQWFAAHDLDVQHTATSEGTISYTFSRGECDDQLISELQMHLCETYGIEGTSLEKIDQVSVIYCLGNNMKQHGVASRATEALDLAEVDIHFISQGLNESVMTFLVDAANTERAVKMLHHMFIGLSNDDYERIKQSFRDQILQTIDS